jgi:hypothetical protein
MGNSVVMRINLRSKLEKVRRGDNEMNVMASVAGILESESARRERIAATLQNEDIIAQNDFDFDLLETDRIFHLSHIKKICIDYRLRFLEANRFKMGIPEEAVSQVAGLERKHKVSLDGFMIVAPSKAFSLENYDDPMLFAPIGNQYYYLVHQWGNDLPIWRKWFVWPVRHIGTFTLFCIVLSVLLTWLLPLSRLGEKIPMASVIVFLFMFKSVFAVLGYGFFMTGRRFNANMWNSKFYNN